MKAVSPRYLFVGYLALSLSACSTDIGTRWPLFYTSSIQVADYHNLTSFWHKSCKILSEWHWKFCETGSSIHVSSMWILQLLSTDSVSQSNIPWMYNLRFSNGLLHCSQRRTNCVSIAHSISTTGHQGFQFSDAHIEIRQFL
jgi:hypothetical protein